MQPLGEVRANRLLRRETSVEIAATHIAQRERMPLEQNAGKVTGMEISTAPPCEPSEHYFLGSVECEGSDPAWRVTLPVLERKLSFKIDQELTRQSSRRRLTIGHGSLVCHHVGFMKICP